MPTQSPFSHTDPDLLAVLEELKRREPIFHTKDFGSTPADFERLTAPDYWETGASGRRYSREFILDTLERNPPVDAATAGWRSYDHAVRRLGADTFLLTYTLRQVSRLSRRMTIWRKTPEDWIIVYHQGTIVSAEEDDALPESWAESPPWLQSS